MKSLMVRRPARCLSAFPTVVDSGRRRTRRTVHGNVDNLMILRFQLVRPLNVSQTPSHHDTSPPLRHVLDVQLAPHAPRDPRQVRVHRCPTPSEMIEARRRPASASASGSHSHEELYVHHGSSLRSVSSRSPTPVEGDDGEPIVLLEP